MNNFDILSDFAPRPKRARVGSLGYSSRVAMRILQGDPSHPGVRLGRVCLDKGIPVSRVTADMGVSKPTVYGWFFGERYPHTAQLEKLKALLLKYAAIDSRTTEA